MPTETRHAIHAYITEPNHTAWHDYAAEQGVSMSALLEALGEQLRDGAGLTTTNMAVEALIKAARRIDSDRRRRGGGNGR